MQTTEVPAEAWAAFLEAFGRAHAGAEVDVEVYDPTHMEIDPSEPVCCDEVHEHTLEAIRCDGHTVSLQLCNREHHLDFSAIEEPRRVIVHTVGAEEKDEALEIRSADGHHTYLRLRVG